MKRSTYFLLLAAVTTGFAQTTDTSRLFSIINADMDRFESLFKKKDTKGVEALIRNRFSKDFRDTGLDGKSIGLEQFIANQKGMIPAVKDVKYLDVKVRDIRVMGSTATGKGSMKLEAEMVNGEDPSKTNNLKVDKTWISTFKKVDGKWWIVSDKTASMKVWVDGKQAG